MTSRSSSSSSSSLLAPPPFLGFPDRFAEFHRYQSQAIFDVLDAQKRVRVLDAPTGFGKSLVPLAIAMLTGQRVLILVVTKILEKQYTDLFESMGLRDVRGAANYDCPALRSREFGRIGYSVFKPTADQGPCRIGMRCHYREDGCPRFDAIRAARDAQVVVTNYSYWLSIGKKLRDDGEDEQLGSFDWVFLDEVHLAERKVCDVMTIEIEERHLKLVDLTPPSSSSDISAWRTFARDAKIRVGGRYDELQLWLRLNGAGGGDGSEIDELRLLKTLDRSLDNIATANGRMVISRAPGKVKFEPVWANPYTESLLLRGIPNVVGMSATVREATMKYLGIDQFDFHEYPSTFPVSNRPVYFMPKVRCHFKMSEQDKRIMIAAGDNIFRTRDDRRTIVHSVSYRLTREIVNGSRYSARMITHKPGAKETEIALKRFVDGDDDGIFVSPAIDTGYDLPDDNAEVCWIPKTPWPSMESEVMKVRVALDRDYPSQYAATTIQQMCGRLIRHQRDRGEAIITDSSAGALFKRGTELFSRWFLNAKHYATSLPKPLRKIRAG